MLLLYYFHWTAFADLLALVYFHWIVLTCIWFTLKMRTDFNKKKVKLIVCHVIIQNCVDAISELKPWCYFLFLYHSIILIVKDLILSISIQSLIFLISWVFQKYKKHKALQHKTMYQDEQFLFIIHILGNKLHILMSSV